MAGMGVSQMNQVVVMTLVLLVVGLVGGTHGQICPNQLQNLNVCAPFVVPGSTNLVPSSACCVALESVDHACLCNTIRIASTLPTQCNLPLSCGN